VEGVRMKTVLLLTGLVVGFLSGAGGLIYLQERNKVTGEMSIMFGPKNYYDSGEFVAVSGTLTGAGIGYPNNTYSIGCYKDRNECWLTSVNAIGGQQIGRMDAPYEYEISKWTQTEVVAGFESQFACVKTTITIERTTKEVLWVEEPVNQTKPICKQAENNIRKYTIENSPGWDKMFGKKS
jgi:hypothetical protein